MRTSKPQSQADFGRAVGITKQAVGKFLQQLEGPAPGTVTDFVLCYCEHLRGIAAGRIVDGDLTEQRRRLTAAQALKVEMANRREAGELILFDDVVNQWRSEFARAKSKLLAVPTKLAPLMVGVKTPGEAQSMIEAVIWEALSELSQPQD